MNAPTLAEIREAHGRIRPHIHRTPVHTSALLDRQFGARLFFKCENLQKAGAFKSRGACNAVFSLADHEAIRGVATHSSGNHAAALARAAALRGIPAHVVMPTNSPAPKQRAVAGYGGKIILCEPTLPARETACARIMEETGASLVHPYNDLRVIAGQATAALELIEEVPDLDVLVSPVGGGGLLSGTALVGSLGAARIPVIGSEPAQADDAILSLREGRIVHKPANTIADGLRTSLGELTFPIIQSYVKEILPASEAAIVATMRTFLETTKLLIEPSAAVPLAAILEHVSKFAGKRVGVILSGGNVDLDQLPWTKLKG